MNIPVKYLRARKYELAFGSVFFLFVLLLVLPVEIGSGIPPEDVGTYKSYAFYAAAPLILILTYLGVYLHGRGVCSDHACVLMALSGPLLCLIISVLVWLL